MKKTTSKKRQKVSRHRGTHTHGRGAKKKARGKGHRGGIGNSGSGKRGDQKKTKFTKLYGGKYFGKSKIRRAAVKIDFKSVSLSRIVDGIDSFVLKGVAKKSGKGYELDLKKFKIIGNSEVGMELKINAFAASKGAIEAVKKGGGEIIFEKKKTNKIGKNEKSKSGEKKDEKIVK